MASIPCFFAETARGTDILRDIADPGTRITTQPRPLFCGPVRMLRVAHAGLCAYVELLPDSIVPHPGALLAAQLVLMLRAGVGLDDVVIHGGKIAEVVQ